MEELIFIQNILAIDVIDFYLQNYYVISPDLYIPPLPHKGGVME